MIEMFANRDNELRIAATDSAGSPIDLATNEGLLRIADLGEYAVTAGVELGQGTALIPAADTTCKGGYARYWVTVGGRVTEYGTAILYPEPEVPVVD